MLKLWKCVYIVSPHYSNDFRVVDYAWSKDDPQPHVSYWHRMFECTITEFTCEEVIPREGMIINVKVYDLPCTEE